MIFVLEITRGSVYMIPARLSFQYEFTPVPSCGSVFVYMIPPQNLIPERVIPVRVHPGHRHWSEIFIPARKPISLSCKRSTTVLPGVKSLSRESGTGTTYVVFDVQSSGNVEMNCFLKKRSLEFSEI